MHYSHFSIKVCFVHLNIDNKSASSNEYPQMDSENIGEAGHTHEAIFSDKAGIVKVYEAVTQYCGFSAIEAGKTMGLFPYGKKNDVIPPLFQKEGHFELSNRNLIIPTYPNEFCLPSCPIGCVKNVFIKLPSLSFFY